MTVHERFIDTLKYNPIAVTGICLFGDEKLTQPDNPERIENTNGFQYTIHETLFDAFRKALENSGITLASIRNSDVPVIITSLDQMDFKPENLSILLGLQNFHFKAPSVTIHEMVLDAVSLFHNQGHSTAFLCRIIPLPENKLSIQVVILKTVSQAQKDGNNMVAVISSSREFDRNGHNLTLSDLKNRFTNILMSPNQNYTDIQYLELDNIHKILENPAVIPVLGQILSQGNDSHQKYLAGVTYSERSRNSDLQSVPGLLKVILGFKNKDFTGFKNTLPDGLHQMCHEYPIVFMNQNKENIELAQEIKTAFILRYSETIESYMIIKEPSAFQKELELPARKQSLLLFPVSAENNVQLKNKIEHYISFLSQLKESIDAYQLGYSMTFYRDHYPEHRKLIAASEPNDIVIKCRRIIKDWDISSDTFIPEKERKIVFVYTGMGPQWWAMGRDLIKSNELFRKEIQKSDVIFQKLSGWSVFDELTADETVSRMEEPEVSQPANFMIQVALYSLWQSHGFKPDAIIGHSTGEAAAFYNAGVYSLEDAVKVIFVRSRLQQKLVNTGKMLVAGISEKEAEELVRAYQDKVSIAAINSVNSVTLAGEAGCIDQILEQMQSKNLFCKVLKVNVPYHSKYMEPIKEELLEKLKDIRTQKANIPLYSTVTGRIMTGLEANAEYWWENIRNPVYFTKAIHEIIKDGYASFLEISPHPVLILSIREILSSWNKTGHFYLSLKRNYNDEKILFDSLSKFYEAGYNINWEAFYPVKTRYFDIPVLA